MLWIAPLLWRSVEFWQCIASGYKTDSAGLGWSGLYFSMQSEIHQSKIYFFYFAEHGLVFP